MQRLPQDLVTQTFFGATLGLAQVQLVWLLVALGGGDDARDRRPLRQLAAPLQVHLGGRRRRPPAADVRLRHGGQRPAPDPPDRARSAASRPSCSRSSSSSSWPATCPRTGRSLVEQDTRLGPLRLPPLPYLAPMVAMWAIALGIVVVQRDLGAALLFFGVFLAMLYVATGRVSLVVIGLVLFLLGSAADGDAVRARPDPDRHLARPVRRPARRGLPGRPGAARLRARRAPRRRPGSRAARRSAGACRSPRSTPTSRWPRSARSSGSSGSWRSSGSTSSSSSAACASGPPPPTTSGRCSRSGSSLVIGIQAFIIAAGQPQGPAADRRHAPVHQLRRLVAARQRARRRPAARPVRQGRRAAAAAARRARAGGGSPGGPAHDDRGGCRPPAARADDHPRRGRALGRVRACWPARPATGASSAPPSSPARRTMRRSSPRPGPCRAA